MQRLVAATLSLVIAGCSVPAVDGRAPAVERWVPVENGALFAQVSGAGPAVVLVHGGQLDHRVFDGQFEALARDYRVVRYDVRGYGRSSDPVEPYASHDDLIALLDALSIERAHLVGFSLGGRIAIDAAVVAPERVASLVLVGPGISGWPWSDADLKTFTAIRETATRGALGEATEAWLAHPWMSPAMEDAVRGRRVREIALDNARCWTHSAPEGTLDPPATERLDEVRCPTSVLVGDRDLDSIHAIAGQVHREVDGARLQSVASCGHVIPMERPQVLLAAIRAHVDELTAP